MIIAEVVYNIAFYNSDGSDVNYDFDDKEKGIRDMLSNGNLERLQKEILQAYENNDILKFDGYGSRHQDSSPERTHTNNSEPVKRNDDDDRNSFYPISEIEGDKNMSFENNNNLKNDLSRRGSKMDYAERRRNTKHEAESDDASRPSKTPKIRVTQEKRGNDMALGRKFSHKNYHYDTLKVSSETHRFKSKFILHYSSITKLNTSKAI